MTEKIATLINALRQELEQYRVMLALLDRQKQQVGARCAEDVYQSIAPIKGQGLSIQRARAQREECRVQLTQALQRPRDSSFAELIPLLPGDCQPLLGTLVRENNLLLARVRQRARQNHLCLSRSIELMQGMINSLFPARETRMYNERGSMKLRRLTPLSMYEAIG